MSFVLETCKSCAVQERIIFMKRMTRCSMCNLTFCQECLMTPTEPLPDFLRSHLGSSSSSSSTSTSTAKKVLSSSSSSGSSESGSVQDMKAGNYQICKKFCFPTASSYWLSEKRNMHLHELDDRIHKFMSADPDACRLLKFYDKPTATLDGTKRKLQRGALVLEQVSDFTGFGAAFRMVKTAYKGLEVYENMIASGVLRAIKPVTEKLLSYGIGPASLYYFGCKQLMDFKLGISPYQYNRTGDTGVIYSTCPSSILDYLGQYAPVGDWLYRSRLPDPHSGDDWSAWYLTRILSRKGFTVISNRNGSSSLPDGTICPGFALVCRKFPCRTSEKNSCSGKDKCGDGAEEMIGECILVIRGSKEGLDWCINLDKDLEEFRYYQDFNEYNDTITHPVVGKAHRGFLNSAKYILDIFCMRSYLTDFLLRGFKLRIVGHSLGAGTAAMIAMELQNGLRLSNNPILVKRVSASAVAIDAPGQLDSRWLHAVGYAPPPIVTEDLADAMIKDGLCLCIANRFDMVTRMSHTNIYELSRDIVKFNTISEKWKSLDTQALADYALYVGKSGDMTAEDHSKVKETKTSTSSSSSTSTTTTRTVIADDSTRGPHEDHIVATTATSSTMTTSSSATSTIASSSLLSSSTISTSSFTTVSSSPSPVVLTTSAQPMPVATVVAPSSQMQGGGGGSDFLAIVPSTVISTSVPTVVASAAPYATATPHVNTTNPNNTTIPITATVSRISDASTVAADGSTPKLYSVVQAVMSTTKRGGGGTPDLDTTTSTTNTYANPPVPVLATAQTVSSSLSNIKVAENNEEIVFRLVPPGQIVDVHDSSIVVSESEIRASLVDHRHPSFRTIVFYWDRLIEEHRMELYLTNLRSLKLQHMSSSRSGISSATSFDRTTLAQTNNQDAEPNSSDNSRSDTSLASGGGSIEGPFSHLSATAATATLVDRIGMCGICDSPCEWAYILRSPAARAMFSRTCSMCGLTICTVCSPAGDTIAGDGINQWVVLPNLSISCPSKGWLQPRRICVHCHLDSYDLF